MASKKTHLSSSPFLPPFISPSNSDGVGRTGTFICIHSQLERLKTEGVVDFFQAAKSARIQRPGLVPDAVGLFFLPFFLEVMPYLPTFTSIGSSLLSTCLTVYFLFLLYSCPINFYLYFSCYLPFPLLLKTSPIPLLKTFPSLHLPSLSSHNLFSQAHYAFCHEVAAAYIDSFETYANFKDVV